MLLDWDVLPYTTLTSAHREYHFEEERVRAPSIPSWRPLIGAMLALNGNSLPSRVYARTLLSWKARGLPAPVVLILTEVAHANRHEQRVRELIATVGFDDHQARIVASDELDQACIDQLSLALDEALSYAPVVYRRDVCPTPQHWIGRLREMLADAAHDELPTILAQLNNKFSTLSLSDRAEAAPLLAQCVRIESARASSVALLQRFDASDECVCAVGEVVRALLQRSSCKEQIEPLLVLLRKWESVEATRTLATMVGTLAARSTLRATIVEHLSQLAHNEAAVEVQRVAAEIENGPKRKQLMQIARRIATNAARKAPPRPAR